MSVIPGKPLRRERDGTDSSESDSDNDVELSNDFLGVENIMNFWTKQKIRSQLSKPGKRGATADGTTVHGATYYLISLIEIHLITMGKHFGGDSECHILFSKILFLYVKRPKVLRMMVQKF